MSENWRFDRLTASSMTLTGKSNNSRAQAFSRIVPIQSPEHIIRYTHGSIFISILIYYYFNIGSGVYKLKLDLISNFLVSLNIRSRLLIKVSLLTMLLRRSVKFPSGLLFLS